MFEHAIHIITEWATGETSFLRRGCHLNPLPKHELPTGEWLLTWRVQNRDESVGTIVAYADEEGALRSAMYHGDDGLQLMWREWNHPRGSHILTYPSRVGKHEMSLETAKAFGVALGMWAADQAAATGGGIVDDCVYVEEQDVWNVLSKEWFGDDDSDGHVNEPLYHTCFQQMYITAKDRSTENMAMDDINRCEH